MTINIITPIYSDTINLLNTLNSIEEIRMSRADLKINYVIIDNMSTDNLVEFLEKYDHFNTVDSLVIEKDNGIFDAMNKGLTRCVEGHVLFLGAGDKILALPRIIDESKVYYGTTIVEDSRYFVSTLDNFFTTNFSNLHHQSMLVPVGFHKPFNTKYKTCADYAHNIEMLIENRMFEFDPDLLAYHMPGGASSNTENVKKEIKEIQQKAKDLLIKGVIPDRI